MAFTVFSSSMSPVPSAKTLHAPLTQTLTHLLLMLHWLMLASRRQANALASRCMCMVRLLRTPKYYLIRLRQGTITAKKRALGSELHSTGCRFRRLQMSTYSIFLHQERSDAGRIGSSQSRLSQNLNKSESCTNALARAIFVEGPICCRNRVTVSQT